MKTILRTTLYFCLILGALFGCREKESDVINSITNDFEILLKQGFDTTGIKDLGEDYLLEGDMRIKKSSLKLTTERQAITSSSHVVSVAKRGNIKVRIDGSVPSGGGNFDWRTEISQAIQEFNAISESSIYMTLVAPGTTADITIFATNIGDPNVIADALLATSDGSPGSQVRINTGFTTLPISSGQKKYNMVHELGHAIGFRHTNGAAMGEGVGLGVGSSPNTGLNPDPSSVFNGGTALSSWSAFSSWDTYAIAYLYPPLPLKLTATSHVHNFVPNSSGMTNQYVSGTITAKPGRRINLATYINHNSLYANYYIITCNITGANFNDSSNWISRSGSLSSINYYDTKWFIMPSSGSVSWSGQFQINDSSTSSIGFIEAF